MKPLRLALAVPFALALAGCSILGSEQRDPVTIYAPDVRVAPRAEWPAVAWTLVIAKPTAARVTDSPRISVRPTPGELQVYRGVSWALPATDMLQDAVQRTLEDSGKIPAVASADAGVLGDYKLVMDLRRFEADYAGGALPAAVVEVNAKLVNNRDQRVIASRTFLQQRPASSVDVAQVAPAFEHALEAATADIVGWVLASGNGDPKAPR
ncbi:cholesterol transport system auxiliary component [Pseudoxanthomonas japonensis]|jgi:cholesterol transport system auxiliary component|uniref:ABC transporter n=1 Tax=Archangium gephyra TaxID=48 RepID=A0A2W5SSJ1_9BACT|nr:MULTISPECIES: ABC-type transport auxiliary lipoprotein family protein [Pseudoxanthomonas]MBA3928653.1 ABC transporter [Xanthomonas sp.]MBL8256956.1 membrane integrity-associated transporter subunit PqiC [Pseudoxanthomonas mexicana]MDR7067962.1 cholesterol transport system auxiliary component [Pseudoxanthomonas japonensis]PZR02446.1 MAG: ABC transporter [Archangium gephyra]